MPETGPQGEESPRVWVKLFQSIVAEKREQVENFKKQILVNLKNKSDNYRAQYAEVFNDLPCLIEKEFKDEMLKLVHSRSHAPPWRNAWRGKTAPLATNTCRKSVIASCLQQAQIRVS